MRTVLIPLIVFSVILNACEKTSNIEIPNEIIISKTTEKIIQSDNEFGIDLFKRVVNSYPSEKNVFISPVSAALALSMTYNGASGETKEAMEITLKKEGLDIDEINQSYRDLMEGLKSIDPNVILNIANSIWYKNEFSILPLFIQNNQNYYNAEVRALNFNDPASLDIINGWVSDKTNDKIKEILEEISSNAVMYLINAIYFNGTWKIEFKESDTKPLDFFPENGETSFQVNMMAVKDTFNYFSNNTFEALEIPYGNGHYSMIVLLPQSGKTTTDISSELSPENWKSCLSSMSENEVQINLPKFKFEFEDSLNNELTDMGMGIAFSPLADFTKINPDGGLSISMVKQKTYVDVNEKGTEAEAVTIVEIIETSFPPDNTINFIVNRPFIFVITEKQSKSIVFIGKVVRPEYQN